METENKLQHIKDTQSFKSQENDLMPQNKDENLNINNDNESVSEKVAEPKTNDLQVQAKTFQKPLTPYQQYKQSKNKNGGKYFQFYDDIKVYTHNIYDW